MVELKEFAVPIAVAALTAFVTALIAVTAKFAPSDAEAISGLRRFGARIFYYCWAAWLLYMLSREVISPEPITRAAVFSIAIYTTCLGIFFMFYLLKGITKVLKQIIELHSKHQGITDALISMQKVAEITAITDKLDGVTKFED
jgi:hypothetical protein